MLYFRHRAEGVKTTAETVKHALVGAKTAQMSAEKAIARAKADIGDTETRLAQVTLPLHTGAVLSSRKFWCELLS